MKKRFLIAWLITGLVGSGLHFLYDLCPAPLISLIAPVSESVWEHLKLLYWPFLGASAILAHTTKDRPRAWSAFLASLLLQPLVLTALYYLMRNGFGVESVFADILLYFLVLAGGFYLSFRLYGSGTAERLLGVLIVLAAIYGVSLMVFTLAAPNLPIFIAP
jgi:hypothetical protein